MVCTSPACEEFAKLMAESVNRSLDPCANFDAYVCSGWRTRRKYSVHAELVAHAIDKMTEVVSKDTSPPTTGQNIVQKAGLLYRSCDMVWRGERDELPVIKECFRRAGIVWPHLSTTPDVLRTLLSLSIEFGWAVIIRVAPVRHTIWIHLPLSFDYAVEQQERLRRQDSRRSNFEFIRKQFSGVHEESLVKFEEVSKLEDAFLPPLATAGKELSVNAFPAGSLDEDKWMKLLAEFNVTTTRNFRTFSLNYVMTFLKLWNKHGEIQTHLFVSWMAARYVSLFANYQLISNYYGTTNHELIRFQHGSWCYRLVYRFVGDYLFVPYNAEAFYLEIRQDVERIVLSIRNEFASRLSSRPPYSADTSMRVRWSSLDTVMSALNRSMARDEDFDAAARSLPDMDLSLIKNWEASRAMFRLQSNDTIPRTLGWHTVHKFAPYSIWLGDYVLAPYVLSFPLYDLGLLDAVKYGAFGANVARASAQISLIHYLNVNATASVIKDARQCVRTSEGSYTLAALSDLVALNVLADAFKSRGSRTRLASLSTTTEVQLFFLAWCYIRCRGYSEAMGDDCNAAMRHVPAFSSAFSCPLGGPLNPQNKCAVF
ncbi:membrane metallo-endopeptidase-like 1 [Amblyomma americanum]